MYHLVGKDGKKYLSSEKGTIGGHRKLKIYGRLDCPSALRHIQNGSYVNHRVFLADELTAIQAGYRPCAVCMKEHYKQWKEGKLMLYALEAKLLLNETSICQVTLGNDTTKELLKKQIQTLEIKEKIQDGLEDWKISIDGQFCLIHLLAEKSQWGYTIIWDYENDEVINEVQTPYVIASKIANGQLIQLYLLQYWGHDHDLEYSIMPVREQSTNLQVRRVLDTDEIIEMKDIDDCDIQVKNGKIMFRVGNQTWKKR